MGVTDVGGWGGTRGAVDGETGRAGDLATASWLLARTGFCGVVCTVGEH